MSPPAAVHRRHAGELCAVQTLRYLRLTSRLERFNVGPAQRVLSIAVMQLALGSASNREVVTVATSSLTWVLARLAAPPVGIVVRNVWEPLGAIALKLFTKVTPTKEARERLSARF